jgi:hypothetical protein
VCLLPMNDSDHVTNRSFCDTKNRVWHFAMLSRGVACYKKAGGRTWSNKASTPIYSSNPCHLAGPECQSHVFRVTTAHPRKLTMIRSEQLCLLQIRLSQPGKLTDGSGKVSLLSSAVSASAGSKLMERKSSFGLYMDCCLLR